MVADLLARLPAGADAARRSVAAAASREQPLDRRQRVAGPRVAILGRGREHLDRDVPGDRRGAHDVRAARQHLVRERARALVEQSPDRRVDELLAQHSQPPRVQLGGAVALGAAEQPGDHRHARDRLHQRRDAVRIADIPLRSHRRDRRDLRRVARRPAHGMAGGDQLARQRPAAPAAADDQHPRHATPPARGPRGRGTPPRARASRAARG